MGGEGSKAVWNFSENSSVLVTASVPETNDKKIYQSNNNKLYVIQILEQNQRLSYHWVTTQISVWHSFNFPGCQYWQPVQSTKNGEFVFCSRSYFSRLEMGMKQSSPEQNCSVERLLRARQQRMSGCCSRCFGIDKPRSGAREVVVGIGAVSWLCKESGLLSGGQERGHRRGETVTWGRQNVPKWVWCDKICYYHIPVRWNSTQKFCLLA